MTETPAELPEQVPKHLAFSDTASIHTDITESSIHHYLDNPEKLALRPVFHELRRNIRKACKRADPMRSGTVSIKQLYDILEEMDAHIHTADLKDALEYFGTDRRTRINWDQLTRNLSYERQQGSQLTLPAHAQDVLLRIATPKNLKCPTQSHIPAFDAESSFSLTGPLPATTLRQTPEIPTKPAVSVTSPTEYGERFTSPQHPLATGSCTGAIGSKTEPPISPLGPTLIHTPFAVENSPEGVEFLRRKKVLEKLEAFEKYVKHADIERSGHLPFRVFRQLLSLFRIEFNQEELDHIKSQCLVSDGKEELFDYRKWQRSLLPSYGEILDLESPLTPRAEREIERWSKDQVRGRDSQFLADVINDNIPPEQWRRLSRKLPVPGAKNTEPRRRSSGDGFDATQHWRSLNPLLTQSELGKPKSLLQPIPLDDAGEVRPAGISSGRRQFSIEDVITQKYPARSKPKQWAVSRMLSPVKTNKAHRLRKALSHASSSARSSPTSTRSSTAATRPRSFRQTHQKHKISDENK